MPRVMTKTIRFLTAVLVGLVCVTLVASCGGGDPSGDIVAQVGNTPISRALLNEWMEAVTGGDYFEHLSKVAPRGLATDPPNYPRCIATAEKIAVRSANGRLEATRAQLASKCRQLYQALKEQALALLISIFSRVGEGAEHGLHVSKAEVNKFFESVKARQFPTQADYQTYLAQRDWNQSIETLQLERNIITTKIQDKFQASGPNGQQALIRFLINGMKKWTAKTTCRPGYVIAGCREYNSSQKTSTTAPAPAPLLEELVGAE
jgi:hypothetical protein